MISVFPQVNQTKIQFGKLFLSDFRRRLKKRMREQYIEIVDNKYAKLDALYVRIFLLCFVI